MDTFIETSHFVRILCDFLVKGKFSTRENLAKIFFLPSKGALMLVKSLQKYQNVPKNFVGA